MAKSALEKEDFVEADKALTSATIVEPENIEVLLQHGYVLLKLERYNEAKEVYQQILSLDEKEDMAHASLANVLHKLSQDELAKEHHLRAIELDKDYAPHYFNYANTLYELGENEEALVQYKKALALDATLDEAKKMIDKLSNK
jgi:tetratricopeptide (TPR) repeat protein